MSEMDRLESAREKVNDITQKKSRLLGELSTRKAREKEIKAKCREDFDCDVDKLPDLMSDLKNTGRKLLEKAESLLNSSQSAHNDMDELTPGVVGKSGKVKSLRGS